MADGYAIKNIDDMEGIYGGAMKRARAELGVEAFGLSVIDLPPNLDAYPEHDHGEDGQEEVYIPVSGSCTIEIDGEGHTLGPGQMARVSSGVNRKLITGEDPLRVIAIGGIPGSGYEAPDSTQLGAPDPAAQS